MSFAGASASTGGSYSVQSKGHSGDYAMKTWLQQSPRSDPWTAVARLGGQRLDVANGDKNDEQQGTSAPSSKMVRIQIFSKCFKLIAASKDIESAALTGRKAKTV